MSKQKDKIFQALENISNTFDELGFSPTIPISKEDKAHFVDWFKFEIDTIKALSQYQDRRIAGLEEQLKNAIVSKFRIDDKVYVLEVYDGKILSFEGKIKSIYKYEDSIWYFIKNNDFETTKSEKYTFATKEEAEAKLKEISNDSRRNN